MSSFRSRYKRRQERHVRVKFSQTDLPIAEKPQPANATVLRGHNGVVWRVVAIPESGLIATGTFSAPGLRIFALGDGDPLHVCSGTESVSWRALAALGGDVLAYGDKDCRVSTWCASAGARLEVLQLGDGDQAMSMAPLGPGQFVVGTRRGALLFFSHRDGRDLQQVAPGDASHESLINDIAVCGDAIVTASADKTAAVWSAVTRERVAVLRGHTDRVLCAAVCARFIATGSDDGTIRLFQTGEGHALARVIEGLHSITVSHVGFVGEELLMSASFDDTVAFTSLSSAQPIPVARLDAGFLVHSAMVTPDARIACAGEKSGGAAFAPPALVASAVKNHAASVFTSRQSLTFAKNEPLQAAIVEVLEGSRGAGDACRALVRKENCSRSIEELASAHRLLMIAVERREIPGELHFEGALFYWFENLYTPSRCLELGEDDWILVKEYAYEAKRAGVISEPEAVLASVLGGQDLLKNVAKLQVSCQKVVSLLWEVMVKQAESDVEMRKLVTKVKSIDRTQKLNAVFGFVFSFVPLGGNALAQGLVGIDQVWSLLDSTMSAGVGIQGAVTPLVLDKFVGRAASMIAPAGWKTFAAKDQVMFKEAVEALDISWEDYCDTIQNAAAQRGCEPAKAIEDGAEGESASIGSKDEPDSVPRVVDTSLADIDTLSGDSCVELHSAERSETSARLAGGVAISNLIVSDSGQVGDFDVLEAAAADVIALGSMKNESHPEIVAAVMINFAEQLRPLFIDLTVCLKDAFRKKAICGDMLVSYPEGKLYTLIVAALADEEKYSSLDADARESMEWRLQRFLAHVRIKG